MDQQALWMVAVIGTGTLIGVFWKMKGGFGPLNLRVVGLVLIAVMVALLAIAKPGTLNAAMGIFGAIAGYLFGAREDSKSSGNVESGVDASGATFGDNARMAGRDLNETVNNIHARVAALGELISRENAKIDRLVASQESGTGSSSEYLLNTIYERGLEQTGQAISTVVTRWELEGWKLMGMTSDYQGMDGIFLLFERPSSHPQTEFLVYHGSSSNTL